MKKPIILHACATCSDLQSNLSTIILDGNSEIGAYVRSNLCYLMSLKQSQITFVLTKKPIVLHACATCSELQSNLGTISLDGNSEIGAYVRSNLCYLMSLKQSQITFVLTKKPIVLHACATCSGLQSNLGSIILDGNSVIGAYVRSNLCFLMSLKHLI